MSDPEHPDLSLRQAAAAAVQDIAFLGSQARGILLIVELGKTPVLPPGQEL